MSDNTDIVIAVSGLNLNSAPTLKKPPYLILLSPLGAAKTPQRFISLDKPESINGFIQVKGIFSDKIEDEIIKNFTTHLTDAARETILEMMFPLHRVISIRSLVFSASRNAASGLK
jgi:hypothetical protein